MPRNDAPSGTTITAAVVRKRGTFRIETLTLEPPRADEVLVRMIATGMCHTDIAARDERAEPPRPCVLGHEGAGIVERIGKSVRKVKRGDHVVLTFMSCGHCRNCRRGVPAYCENMGALNFGGAREDGSVSLHDRRGKVHDHFFGQSSFASFALANERNVVKVPKDLPLEILGPLGCGLQTGAGAVMNSFKVGPSASLVVFGAGAVGLAAVMAARAVRAGTIIAVDVVPSRLRLARRLGATHAIDGKKSKDLVAAIRKSVGGGVDFALDTTGRPEMLARAIETLGPGGQCGYVSASHGGRQRRFDAGRLMVAGGAIRGIIQGDSVPDVFIPRLIGLYRRGRFPFDRLLKFYPLRRINQAARDSLSGKTVKPVICMT